MSTPSTETPSAETLAAEEDAKASRVALVLAHCLLELQDRDLEGFRIGFNALYRTDYTIELLVELKRIAMEEAAG